MKKYILKKNLFIFKLYPEIFETEDSYILIGNNENLNKLNLSDFDNVFTLFYLPIWVKHLFSLNKINVIHLNDFGEIEKIHLHKRFKPTNDIYSEADKGLDLLNLKAKTIDNLFKTNEASSLLNYSLSSGIDIYTINKNLDFVLKAILMDSLKLNYKLTNKRAKEITNTLFNLTSNIVSFSFYNKFISQGLNPENGFLNTQTPALIRDLTEIQRIKFLKKVHYLFESRFFEGRDLNRKHFPDTTVKFIKLLSTYFFYGNRFKRVKEIFYLIETLKRGKESEVLGSL